MCMSVARVTESCAPTPIPAKSVLHYSPKKKKLCFHIKDLTGLATFPYVFGKTFCGQIGVEFIDKMRRYWLGINR